MKNSVNSFNSTARLQKTCLAIAMIAALAGCGGGGGDSLATATFNVAVASEPNLKLQPGSSLTLLGSAQTSDAPLSSLTWTVTSPLGAPTLATANSSCAAGAKVTNKNSSDWDCQLAITAPIAASLPDTYTLVFTAVDSLKNTRTVTRTLDVAYNPAYAPADTGIAGEPFSVISGATAPLSCAASAGSTVVWSIVSNGGTPLGLSSYNTSQSNFVAPNVTTPTQVKLSCTATDATNHVTTGNVTVTVLPPATPMPTGITVTPAQTVKSGSPVSVSVTLEGITGMFYQWTPTDKATPSLDLAGSNTNTVSFVAPTVAAPTTYKLQVSYGSKPITEDYPGIGTATAIVVVTPPPPPVAPGTPFVPGKP